jgi:tRNA pseudouridine13 synthase
MYKIKQIPEDFMVEEVPDREFAESGKYSVYILKKTNYNTEDAVAKICDSLNIQRKNISYAGAKDRNAVTSQYIAVTGKARNIEQKDIVLEHKGFTDKPISLGDLKGNKFVITIRNIEYEKIKKIHSFINYFDSQRFSTNNAEIGRYIITKNYKSACELIMSENSRNSENIKLFLQKHKNAYLNALKLVPKKILQVYMHAYQSLLWNKAVEKLSNDDSLKTLPIVGFGVELEGTAKEIYDEILSVEKITLRDFILRDFPEISLEGVEREIRVKVEDLDISEPKADELNAGTKKVVVSFFLKKGAYATMAVKNMVE